MADISKIIADSPINNVYAVMSTRPTGFSSKLLAVANYPKDLTIASIENKFDGRFDDPSYYYGGFSDGGYFTGGS